MKFLPYILKHLKKNWIRTLSTIFAMALCIFLISSLQTLLKAFYGGLDNASTERLVNTLSILSPYGPEEKQCLLEAKDLVDRATALVALAEMELAARDDGSGTSIQ